MKVYDTHSLLVSDFALGGVDYVVGCIDLKNYTFSNHSCIRKSEKPREQFSRKVPPKYLKNIKKHRNVVTLAKTKVAPKYFKHIFKNAQYALDTWKCIY